MEEVYVTFETAKLAKEKGFDWVCRSGFYEVDGEFWEDWDLWSSDHYKKRLISQNVAGAPTQSLLQKWLRDKHFSHLHVNFIHGQFWFTVNFNVDRRIFDSYEEALECALQVALERVDINEVYKNN